MSSREETETMAGQVRRFAVSWRNRARREISPVGALDFQSGLYRFQYLEAAHHQVQGFRPFVGFPNLEEIYESSRLWPFFALRVMERRRPDFDKYVHWLGLERDATPLDILSRTGEFKGDTVALTEAPVVGADGQTSAVLLVRGASYAASSFGSEAAANAMLPGARLSIVDDSLNEANSDALLLETRDGDRIGWVPDLLIPYALALRESGGSVELLQNNGVDCPWHTRFLVRLSGVVGPSGKLFSDPPWPTS